MSKPSKPAYELTDAERRDLTQLIQQGRPLPEKYRFILFEDKREVELVWNGKSREVCTAVLPFQSLEHVDEPRKEAPESAQLEMFDPRGRQVKGWTNKLIWGDNKLILSSLKAGALRRQIEDAGGLKLIYIDPPFDVGADFSMDIEIGGETFHKEPNLLEQIAYRDTWGRGADSFIAMIYERLILMRDLMHEEGSIYVHMGWAVSHYVRGVLDEVFGKNRVLNQIIWKRQTAHSDSGQGSEHLGRLHDVIFLYTKGERYPWNLQYAPYSTEYLQTHYKKSDPETDRRYELDNIIGPGGASKGNPSYEFLGVTRFWRYSRETMQRLYDAGRIIQPSPGAVPRYKRYLDEMPGVPVQDIWDDLNAINSQAKEATGYNTQKPEPLLERILKASSNEGDLVADFFCGSGTTAAVAEKLGRKWIATDLGKFAIHTTRKRLIGVQRELKESGKSFRAFEVLNLGRYERQAYLNVGGRLSGEQKEIALARKESEFRALILRAYRAEPLENGGFFHGKIAGRLVVVGPINLPVGRLFVEEVITECRKRGATRADLLAFEFEMGLFPAVLEEAKGKGIDLVPKQIPPEVFDKRAVEKGQVVFFDISFIGATPRYDKKRHEVKIELTDFSVYYTQGAAAAAAENLKSGKSEVVCEQGQLWKISKDKNTFISKEKLTKHWTDWVDYWAVDFDYESRKELISVAAEVAADPDKPDEFEEQWTGGFIFENEWQSFRTRKERGLELISAPHVYPKAGRYTAAVKVIDIFGNDTMVLVPVIVESGNPALTSPRLRGEVAVARSAGAGEGARVDAQTQFSAPPDNPSPGADAPTSPRKRGEVRAEALKLTPPAPEPPRLPLGEADKRLSDENDRDESLALIRELAGEPSMREGMEREALLRILAGRLGFARLGAKIRNELDTDLITAVERRILGAAADVFQRDTRTIEDYRGEELREQLRAAIGKTWTDQDDAIRQTARHLGFRRAGPVIQDTLKSAINGAIRTGELERGEDGRLRAI